MIRNDIIRMFFTNAVIALIIAAGLTYSNPISWREYLFTALLFSNCIGFTIYTLVHVTLPKIERFHVIIRLGVLLAIFLFGGFFGTAVGLAILRIFHFTAGNENYLNLLIFNLILAMLFASATVTYFSMRERAEQLAKSLKEKELNEELLTRLKTNAELEALQAKINPHFLFNALNSIASLIPENPAVAEETVERLAGLFRHTLQHTGKRSVTLSEELDLVRTYLEIEKVRFGDRLQFEISCDESLREIEVPALIIQPLVENSIKHHIAPAIRGGSVSVAARNVGNTCVITVRDNGEGFQPNADRNGFGLRSIRNRLSLRYGERSSLEIVDSGHTEIVLTLPIAE